MARTLEDQMDWEQQCYGMTQAEVQAEKPEHTDIYKFKPESNERR